MCYSVINPCGYWTSGTLSALVSNRNTLYNVFGVKRHVMPVDLPQSVSISGAEISPYVRAVSTGVLCCNLAESKSVSKMWISKHCHEVTGFLLWIGTYCISCVVQQRSRGKDLFSLVGYDDSCLAEIRHVKSIIRVVQPRQIFAPTVSCSVYEAGTAFTDHSWTQGPSHRATRDALCPLPNRVKLSLWRKQVYTLRERKLWWKKLNQALCERFCQNLRLQKHRMERKIIDWSFDGNFGEFGPFFMGFMELWAGNVGFRLPSLSLFLIVSTTQI